jgi:hypothetical protein
LRFATPKRASQLSLTQAADIKVVDARRRPAIHHFDVGSKEVMVGPPAPAIT